MRVLLGDVCFSEVLRGAQTTAWSLHVHLVWTPSSQDQSGCLTSPYTIGALILRIGFWGYSSIFIKGP